MMATLSMAKLQQRLQVLEAKYNSDLLEMKLAAFLYLGERSGRISQDEAERLMARGLDNELRRVDAVVELIRELENHRFELEQEPQTADAIE
jgi:hypothetical protein